ncbi:SMC-Scp complex subunit ScpB [Sporolituus thermophilus]|uniref:SMC-Scp complex subunit ScpB n=1 Tax=Sporolituus thermophilus TaxID=608505 RepID=UPI000B8338C0|nr:SMC-Scp complex subunit ScpB [Sporolituus thermophilus]
MFYQHLKGHVEALLFASGDPLPIARLAQILEIPEEHVALLLEELAQDMASAERGLTVVQVAGGYQLCTKPEMAEFVSRLAHVQEGRLSVAAMETLAIIAFKQPITKQEVEAIRGVKIDKVLNNLVERRLVREIGRKETIGRPILYGTTDEFLKCFGLKSIEELLTLAANLPEPALEKQP